MNYSKRIAAAAIAVAALSGCASTRVVDLASTEAAPAAAPREVSRPAPSYGSLGGYRYRRLVKVTVTSS